MKAKRRNTLALFCPTLGAAIARQKTACPKENHRSGRAEDIKLKGLSDSALTFKVLSAPIPTRASCAKQLTKAKTMRVPSCIFSDSRKVDAALARSSVLRPQPTADIITTKPRGWFQVEISDTHGGEMQQKLVKGLGVVLFLAGEILVVSIVPQEWILLLIAWRFTLLLGGVALVIIGALLFWIASSAPRRTPASDVEAASQRLLLTTTLPGTLLILFGLAVITLDIRHPVWVETIGTWHYALPLLGGIALILAGPVVALYQEKGTKVSPAPWRLSIERRGQRSDVPGGEGASLDTSED